jgi:hypothetical protein
LTKRIHSGIERRAQAIQAIHYVLRNAKSIRIFGRKKDFGGRISKRFRV